MKLRILSDLHRDMSDFQPAPAEVDVVLLAGDISNGLSGLEWAQRTFTDCPVLCVAGNHEHYGLDMALMPVLTSRWQSGQVQLLENRVIYLGGVRFVGCTLWTDFELFDQVARDMTWAAHRMKDFQLIRHSGKLISPAAMRGTYAASRAFLAEVLAKPFPGKTVVITHHAPSARSIPVHHQNKPLLAAYASNLDDLVAQADVWVHGHLHTACRYQIGKCTVVCNPRGYINAEWSQHTDWIDPCILEV